MKEKYRKYAKLILKRGLDIKPNQPLVVSAPMETNEFNRILIDEACKMGVTDIHFDWSDGNMRHSLLQNLSVEELKKLLLWDKKSWDEYASKDAAFLMLSGTDPELMSDIDSKKMNDMIQYQNKSRPIFKEKQRNDEVSWCIAAVAVEGWAEKIFPNSSNSVNDLWEQIFEICQVNKEDPIAAWNEKIIQNEKLARILNNLNLKTLHYTNGLGTDLTIDLIKDHIWISAGGVTSSGAKILANIPSEEIYTTPDCYNVNGKVYNSKPLIYGGVIIDNFMIEFKDGKVINFEAEKGYDTLKHMIEDDENADMLGEVALVAFDSPISNSGLIFYDTLYDENASCHLALGSSYATCLKDGVSKGMNELQELGSNQSHTHVDFMIGTNDLSVIGIDNSGNEIVVFENGNFSKDLLEA